MPDDLITVDLASVYPELKNLRLRGRLVGNKLVPYATRREIENRGDTAMIEKFDLATYDYETPEKATQMCQNLIKDHEIDLASICINKTTAKWSLYKESWLTARAIAKIKNDNDAVKNTEVRIRQIDPNLKIGE